MSYALIDTTDLTALGNAIRAKTGDTATMAVSEMATAVSGITTDGSGSALPETYMTWGQTTDEQNRNIINVDFYGKVVNHNTFINGHYRTYPCASLKLWDVKNGITEYSNIYQLNINIHDNEINCLEEDFCRPSVNTPGIKVVINPSGTIEHIAQYGCAYTNFGDMSSLLFGIKELDISAFRFSKGFPSVFELPSTLTSLGNYCFQGIDITTLVLPISNITYFGDRSFANCSNLTTVYLLGAPSSSSLLPSKVFLTDTAITDIYVSWSEGAVANAPWGATNATIHYDYVPTT